MFFHKLEKPEMQKHFIADERQEIPKDKTIIDYYVFFDEECYDSSYETYVKYYRDIYHVLLDEEGICWYLTHLKTDEDYVNIDDLNKTIKNILALMIRQSSWTIRKWRNWYGKHEKYIFNH